jgi:hypothetical protein
MGIVAFSVAVLGASALATWLAALPKAEPTLGRATVVLATLTFLAGLLRFARLILSDSGARRAR